MRIEITLALIAVMGTLVGALLGAVSPWWVQRSTEKRHDEAAERVARRVIASELNLVGAALIAAAQARTIPRDPSVLPSDAWREHQAALSKLDKLSIAQLIQVGNVYTKLIPLKGWSGPMGADEIAMVEQLADDANAARDMLVEDELRAVRG